MKTLHPSLALLSGLLASGVFASNPQDECDLDAQVAATIDRLSKASVAERFRWRVGRRDDLLSITLADLGERPIKQREVEAPPSCHAAAELAATLIVAWMSELPTAELPSAPRAVKPPAAPVRRHPPSNQAPPPAPPAPPQPEPPAPHVEVVSVEPTPPPSPSRAGGWDTSLSLDFKGQWAGTLAPAAALSVDVGERWGGFLELEGIWPRRAAFFEGAVNWQRSSVGLGARRRFVWGRLFLEPGVSAAMVLMVVWGQGFAVDRRQLGIDVAGCARLHAGVEWEPAVALFVGSRGCLWRSNTAQVVGESQWFQFPRGELSAVMGVSWRFLR
ncbi:MAG: hypothetical protein ACOZIN_04425 [Myxococcota bacterium]